MTMYEQANKLNDEFKVLFDKDMSKEDIINLIIHFGQIAKFRCRSNIAYKNFLDSVFRDIAKIDNVKIEGLDFEPLKVVEVIKKD